MAFYHYEESHRRETIEESGQFLPLYPFEDFLMTNPSFDPFEDYLRTTPSEVSYECLHQDDDSLQQLISLNRLCRNYKKVILRDTSKGFSWISSVT